MTRRIKWTVCVLASVFTLPFAEARTAGVPSTFQKYPSRIATGASAAASGVRSGATTVRDEVSTPYAGTPLLLPGTIEAEHYDHGGPDVAYHDESAGNSGGAYRATDVDLESTTDAGGGYNVGWATAREWLNYTVAVEAGGSYRIEVRVASLGEGGTFHIEVDAIDRTGPIHVPNTGDWQAWTTVTRTGISLPAGQHVLRLVLDTDGTNGAVGNFNWIRVAAAPTGSTPFTGTPVVLPGTIEAEAFDNGGSEVAYHDASAGNSGGAYRTTDVDLEATADAGGGCNVGWVTAHEWLNFTVHVAAAGNYTFEARVASSGAGGAFHIEVGGVDKTGPIQIPDTGGWQSWTTLSRSGVVLTPGTQIIRVVMDTGGVSGAVGNINWIRVTFDGGSTPYTGTPVALPGTIETENFDNGGPEIAFHDSTQGNAGGAYRATDVDLERTNDGVGYNVGWAAAGEWLNYTIAVATAGNYAIDLRVASLGPGGTFHIEVNGLDKTGPIDVPDTGGWQTWTTLRRSNIALTSGIQVLRLVMDTAGSSTAIGNFDWIRIEAAQTAPFKITTPTPGSTLRRTTITFRWEGSADEFWLNVGSTPGSADLHASGPLGSMNEHTVSLLPLDGRKLYVQLWGTTGGVTEIVKAEYTAPIRRGLAIITDFADRTLEDWTGPGIKSIDDLSVQLRNMEDHWAWLSRGRERFQWDIIRVRLSAPAVANAYPDWNAFRNAVVMLARQQIQTVDYDVNNDGVIDAVWLIVSSGTESLPFAIGGMSRNTGANLFVDGQTGGSVNAGATGNFNHELGHCLGLPDMYGTYGTMSSLTVMSFSWDVPPPDFSAYERMKLGWLAPQIVSETTTGVWLPSANDKLAAVLVPTRRPDEYFLIEYRKRPPSGYGSRDLPFNGLAVYHVFEGSSMGQDPPLMKLEPADGSIAPSQPTDPYDFIYPENPRQVLPMVLTSYFGEGGEVFRIEQIAWRDGGLAFNIVMPGPQLVSANLLLNSSFESGASGSPTNWVSGSWVSAPSAFIWPSPVALTGASSAHLHVPFDDDIWWSQPVTGLISGEAYVLCGWLKGEGIGGQGSVGANVSLLGGFTRSDGLVGTFDWTRRCVTFTASTPRVEVACRLGFYGSTISGKLWCDDLTLEGLRSAF